MISGTSTDYVCVWHVGNLHQYNSAATSAEWTHVIVEHSVNHWHSSIALCEIFQHLKGVKSQKTETFLKWVVQLLLWCVQIIKYKIRLHIPTHTGNAGTGWETTENYAEKRIAIPRKES